MSIRFLAAAASAAFLLGVAVPAVADTMYGAIATSDSYYGLYTNASSKAEARSKALAACNRMATKKDESCTFRVWFTRCGAVAENDKYVAYGLGTTEAKAKAEAMSSLNASDGSISASGCNDQ